MLDLQGDLLPKQLILGSLILEGLLRRVALFSLDKGASFVCFVSGGRQIPHFVP